MRVINTERSRNLLFITVIFFLILFTVTFVFKTKNQNFTLAYKYNLNQLEKEAELKYYQGKYEESIQLYKKILTESKTDLEARKNLAVLYTTINDYQAAIEEYQQVVKAGTEDYLVYYSLGELYYNLGKYQQALPYLKKAVRNLNDQEILTSAYLYLTQIYRNQTEYQLALDAVNEALELDSDTAMAYYYLGLIKDDLGQREAAIDAYKKALNKDGSFENIHLNLAEDYLKLKEYKLAISKYKEVLADNPRHLLAKRRLQFLKDLKPKLFLPPEQEKEEEKEEQEKVLEKKVTFAQIEPVPNKGDLPQLRIGLAEAREYLAFRVKSQFVIKRKDTQEILFKGKAKEPWQLVAQEDGRVKLLDKEGNLEQQFFEPVIIEAQGEAAPILLHNIKYGQGYYWAGQEDRQYRGEIEINPNSDSFTVINLVNLEAYLYSVVPSEMMASWPLEALKVQAVAARSYTLFHLGKHAEDGYDLCATVHCASYRGITREHPNSTKAVNETLGEVMTYEGKPVNAVYSANSGGHTESSADVWGGKVPYLQGVTTTLTSGQSATKKGDLKREFPLPPYELQNWLKSSPQSYSAQLSYGSPNRYRWQRIIKAEDIADKLEVGKVKRLIPISRAEGGTVKAIRVVGTTGEEIIERGLRSFFGGLRSSRFFIITQYGNDGLPEQFIFYGGGWGHNVGMDQVAAANMAQAGYNYDRILLHFYSGVKLIDKY